MSPARTFADVSHLSFQSSMLCPVMARFTAYSTGDSLLN